MSPSRLRLLRSRITSTELYDSPQRGGGAPAPPARPPRLLRDALIRQLDALDRAVAERRPGDRDEQASREIIAIRPTPGAQLDPEQLDSQRADARLIGRDEESGVVLLDVADPHLGFLRDKVEAFADDARVRTRVEKDGTTSTHRDKERAIAPVGEILLAPFQDVRGPLLRHASLPLDRPVWFEVACRGGYRRPPLETQASRGQIARLLHRFGLDTKFDEFAGPEAVYFFLRLTRIQLEQLQAAADCIYDVDLAPLPIRDLKLLEHLQTRDVASFFLTPPGPDAPSVVLLDTGIATGHPLLKSAILSATKAGESIPSVEDTHGHGTQMAGIALYSDLGGAIVSGSAAAPHWIASSRLLVEPRAGTAADENYEQWPVLTLNAVRAAEQADPRPRDRAFALAVTRSMQDPPLDGLVPTLWSHAVDQIAHNDGQGRLLIISAGNAREPQWLTLADQYPQLQLSEKIHQPAQAANALTVGAYTAKVALPPGTAYRAYAAVATRAGGISPFTSTGLPGSEWPIKPDVVMEGGNLARAGNLTDATVPTLVSLTTSLRFNLDQPVGLFSMTSEGSARAAYLAARVWAAEPKLRPQTVRGLIVHSASWTPEMLCQFESLNDRLLACGYGVPDEALACECARDRATVVLEDEMPNAMIEEETKKEPPKRPTTKSTEPKHRRSLKLYRLPVPLELIERGDVDVELRVTLSYFAEPNKFRRSVYHGLDLKWDMQGPAESEKQFLERVNARRRPIGADGKRSKSKSATTESFPWRIGIQQRSRGTVQSDRWSGKLSDLVGDKLIAVLPVRGWWDQRRPLKTLSMPFSLIVSVFGPGVYAAIQPKIEIPVEAQVEVPI